MKDVCVFVCLCEQVGRGGIGFWVLVSGQVSGFRSTGVHRTQGGGGSGTALVGGSSQVITGQDQGGDQGLDDGDGLHIIRQVSQKHLCVEEEFQST